MKQMNLSGQVRKLWDDINNQVWDNLSSYFASNAVVNWNNTNEQFSVEEFAAANREYPGKWNVDVERIEEIGNLVISVVKVRLEGEEISFHATSFFEFEGDKIILLNEYWGDDGSAPQWRIDRKIGRPICVLD